MEVYVVDYDITLRASPVVSRSDDLFIFCLSRVPSTVDFASFAVGVFSAIAFKFSVFFKFIIVTGVEITVSVVTEFEGVFYFFVVDFAIWVFITVFGEFTFTFDIVPAFFTFRIVVLLFSIRCVIFSSVIAVYIANEVTKFYNFLSLKSGTVLL